jgi:ATP-dependent DNA helicase RecG
MAKKTIPNFNARAYMELAIAEMNKSKNEPRPDGKVPPKVGAIIVFPDGKVIQAHRGELREGDHAEFTLIERKLLNEKLDDCVLFTTLEPCVKRNDPKVPCCRRTTNARIKTVYVGIGDPDPTVDGKGILHLEKAGVDVIMFDNDLQKIIEKENTEFRKQAIERKNEVETVEEIPIIEQVVTNIDFDELSAEALQKYILKAKLSYQIEQPQFKKHLTNIGVLAIDTVSNTLKPTGVGILLFGANPRETFKQAALKCSADYGDYQGKPESFDQPLVLIPDLVEEWLKKSLAQFKDTSSFERKDKSSFPLEVLREAVINAIVHRDYTIEGGKSSILINSDSIVINSPGAPLPSISLEQLNTFKAPSLSRNPIIAYVFNEMEYMEETGLGMSALKSLNEKYDLPLPEFTFEEPFLKLTFPKTFDAVKKVSKHTSVVNLNNEELKGYEFIKSKGEVKRSDYEEHFEFDKKKAERHLNKMVEENLIERKGAGRSTYYVIIAT